MSAFSLQSKGLLKIGLALFLALAPAIAEARLGGGSSSGSRGMRTQSAPPMTNTAPRSVEPIQRSATPNIPGRPPIAPQASPGFFGGGFGRGLLGGLLGAGLIGMFMGHGFMGGLGGIMSFFGLLLQVGLIAIIGMFIWNMFRRRDPQPAMAGYGAAGTPYGAAPVGGGLGGLAGGAPPATSPITLQEQDFGAFEGILAASQKAYGEENMATLRTLATDEMAQYFQTDLDENRRKGVIEKTSDAKLLQGDLSEAWREGQDEYATVAMRFSVIDVTLDRATGRVVAGDPAKPTQATELWTFVRRAGAGSNAWRLSAIQQAA